MISILVSFLSVAGTLYNHNRCCGQTIVNTTADSLTSQVGGFAVFECPGPEQYDREPNPRRRLQIVQWTKDVSVYSFYIICILY